MSGEVGVRAVSEGYALDLVAPDGPRCRLRFGVPGEPVEGWTPGEDDLVYARAGDVETRVRLFQDVAAWTVSITVDNRSEHPVQLPELGLGVTLADRCVGWSWTSDLAGFIAVAAEAEKGPVAVVRLKQGFLRPVRESPVFADAATSGEAFHLAPPRGALGPHRRHQVTLQVELRPSLSSLADALPGWLPDVIVDAGEQVSFATPDEGVLPGDNVNVTLVDTTAVASLESPGRGCVSLHGVRGVQRIWLAEAPPMEALVPPLAEAVMLRRPGVRSSGAGLLVAEALANGLVTDEWATLDWLEREAWLDRRDLEGVAIAATLALAGGDAGLLDDAWAALAALPASRGFGLVTLKLGLAALRLAGGAPPLAGELLARPGEDPDAALELAVLAGRLTPAHRGPLAAVVASLGDVLPGQPLGLSALEAARRVALVRLCPPGFVSLRAAATANKAYRLLLADYATRLQPDVTGLGWLLLGHLGA